MKRSLDKILTTHTGSFARDPELRDLLLAKGSGKPVDEATLDEACRKAVENVVKMQADIGLSVINDGDQSKTGFSVYVRSRLLGFEGAPEARATSLEMREFPEYFAERGQEMLRSCNGPVEWNGTSELEKDIAHLKASTAHSPAAEIFMTAVSPGSIANFHPNHYYATREQYLTAIADAMKTEYDAIAKAGFILQVDSPDLAGHSRNFPDMPLKDWQKVVAENIDILNYATRDIDPDRVRVHVCWGADEAPHNHDTDLADIADIILKARPTAFSIVCANARHEHEWQLWEDKKLPEGKIIIPGVIDSTTNIVEHPEVVAARIVRYARVVGRENMIAGVDCGFGTVVRAKTVVDGKVAWAKLRSLVEGAKRASDVLWN